MTSFYGSSCANNGKRQGYLVKTPCSDSLMDAYVPPAPATAPPAPPSPRRTCPPFARASPRTPSSPPPPGAPWGCPPPPPPPRRRRRPPPIGRGAGARARAPPAPPRGPLAPL
eukprot:2729626-Pyramimonas_sp.AAC.1